MINSNIIKIAFLTPRDSYIACTATDYTKNAMSNGIVYSLASWGVVTHIAMRPVA